MRSFKEATAGWKKSNKIIVFGTLILLMLLIIFRITVFFENEPVEKEKPVNVKIETAAKMSINTTSPITGRVEPVEEVNIVPMATGEITSVNVALGDRVSKGTLLFSIDGTQMATTYNKAKEAYNLAKTNFDRMSLLYKEGAVSLQNFEQAEANYVNAQESYTAAGDAYSNCNVTSPIDGYVTSINVSVGNIATSAVPSLTVADVSSLIINTSVSEYIVGEIKVGDEVEIFITTLGKEAYKGEITAISPAPANGSLTYPIKVKVMEENDKIKAGMFAEIRIISAETDSNAVCIPSDSVILKNGKSLVVTLDEHNVPSFVEVITGLDNGEYVEITSGLKEGETFVISGQQYVEEGTKVNVVSEE